MRCEHGPDVEREHRLLDRIGRCAKFSELVHRPSSRRGLRLSDSPAEVRVPPPYAVGLLGGVDQQKEQCERAGGDRALLDCERVDFAQQIVEARRSQLAVPPRARRGAKALDNLERFLSFQSLDDASERSRQPADVVVERKVLLSRGDGHSR
jgi:hypothetical protein